MDILFSAYVSVGLCVYFCLDGLRWAVSYSRFVIFVFGHIMAL